MNTPAAARIWWMASLLALGALAGCSNSTQNTPTDRNDLSKMHTDRLTIKGHTFTAWLALTLDEQQKGLMQVPQEALATLPDGSHPGMLFVFPTEQMLSFWMLNTISPLDIIYFRADGVIVRKYTMAPLETRLYPSIEPAMYALEVRAGLLDELGIGPGDRVELPSSVLNLQP
jgi:uncharacterized membrane protein (UPF0127 family)